MKIIVIYFLSACYGLERVSVYSCSSYIGKVDLLVTCCQAVRPGGRALGSRALSLYGNNTLLSGLVYYYFCLGLVCWGQGLILSWNSLCNPSRPQAPDCFLFSDSLVFRVLATKLSFESVLRRVSCKGKADSRIPLQLAQNGISHSLVKYLLINISFRAAQFWNFRVSNCKL